MDASLTDLHQEAIEGERILPQKYPTAVPKDLGHVTQYHAATEGPRLVFQAKKCVNDESNAEDDEKKSVDCKRGSILVNACLSWTQGQSAIRVRPIDNVILRICCIS